MGSEYTRNDAANNIADGNVISAADLDGEFDKLVTAFAAGTGHSHDGTAGEGGYVTKLLGTSLTIGDGTAGTDITVTFDGESSDGVLTWMEDEEKYTFSAIFNINNKGEILEEWFGKSTIKSDRRFSYEEAQEIIETKKGKIRKEIALKNKEYKIKE